MILFILLSVIMFVDCVLLVFLVLLQLPKKEAGMGGMAFGGAATDALFGAGSGNVLTKITKYVAGVYFGVALLMAVLAAHKPKSDADKLMEKVTQHTGGLVAPAPAPAPESAPGSTPAGGGLLQLSTNLAPEPAAPTNAGAAPAPAPPSTNAPAGPAPPATPAPPVNTNK
jgi:preprotein translocase subunit SecG